MNKETTLGDLKQSIRNIPDFPKKGIMFKDITTALKQPAIFRFVVESFYRKYKEMGITIVAGIESRGFIIGSALAYKLGAGFVPIRKPGKLPAAVYSKSYSLEYGQGILEIHKDALEPGDIVLLHDDLLATGGSAAAAIELIGNFNIKPVATCFIIELVVLEGRKAIGKDHDIFSLLSL